MAVILGIVGIVLGAFVYQPAWFEGVVGYVYHSTHKSLEECENAKLEDGDVCVNEYHLIQFDDIKPFQLYVKQVKKGD